MAQVDSFLAFKKMIESISSDAIPELLLGSFNQKDEDDDHDDLEGVTCLREVQQAFKYSGEPYLMYTTCEAFPFVIYGPEDRILFHTQPSVKYDRNKPDWFKCQAAAFKEIQMHIKQLTPLCVPSAFGDLKTNKTVVDEHVRAALETKDIRFTPEARIFLQDLREEVSKKLFGDRSIEFRFNKLNMYTKGGFFNQHIDTPRDGVLGTMLIVLPSMYEGGEFVMKTTTASSKPEREVADAEYDDDYDFDHSHVKWGCKVGCQDLILDFDDKKMYKPAYHTNAYMNMRILCFYGHIPHEVLPVTSGTRITLSFYITAAAASPSSSEEVQKEKEQDQEQDQKKSGYDTKDLHWVYCQTDAQDALIPESQLASKIRALSKCLTEVKRPLGFFLNCKYSLDDIRNHHWKGVDTRMVNAIRQQADWKYEVVPVLEKVVQDADDESKKVQTEIFRFTEADINELLKGSRRSDGAVFAPMNFKNVLFLNHSKVTTILSNDEEDEVEHTGNESRPGYKNNRYYTTVLILGLRFNGEDPDTEDEEDEKDEEEDEKKSGDEAVPEKHPEEEKEDEEEEQAEDNSDKPSESPKDDEQQEEQEEEKDEEKDEEEPTEEKSDKTFELELSKAEEEEQEEMNIDHGGRWKRKEKAIKSANRVNPDKHEESQEEVQVSHKKAKHG